MQGEELVPNPGHALDVLSARYVRTKWMRDSAKGMHLDPQRLVLGSVLNAITGDDQNFFGIVTLPNKDPGETGRRILAVLDWEIHTPEIPHELGTKLKDIKHTLEHHPWNTSDDAAHAYEIWSAGVKQFTEQFIKKNGKCREAQRYYNANKFVLHEPWERYQREQGYLVPRTSR